MTKEQRNELVPSLNDQVAEFETGQQFNQIERERKRVLSGAPTPPPRKTASEMLLDMASEQTEFIEETKISAKDPIQKCGLIEQLKKKI